MYFSNIQEKDRTLRERSSVRSAFVKGRSYGRSLSDQILIQDSLINNEDDLFPLKILAKGYDLNVLKKTESFLDNILKKSNASKIIPNDMVKSLLIRNPFLLWKIPNYTEDQALFIMEKEPKALLRTTGLSYKVLKKAILSKSFEENTKFYMRSLLRDSKTPAMILDLLITRTDIYYHEYIRTHSQYKKYTNLASTILEVINSEEDINEIN